MALLDLLGRRWTLRLLWELRDGALTSRGLRQTCDDISPTVLQARLSDLRAADLVEHQRRRGYVLTSMGGELLKSFAPLYSFADRWAARAEASGD